MLEGTQGALPKEADVVIIGAGIHAITTAINLAERGMSVTISEKGSGLPVSNQAAYSQIISYQTR